MARVSYPSSSPGKRRRTSGAIRASVQQLFFEKFSKLAGISAT
jgi:hypothetical protein